MTDPRPRPRRKSRTQGIETRHARSCASRGRSGCNCTPTYQAVVWSKRDQRRIYQTFPTLAAARAWRADSQVGLRKGTMRAPSAKTLRQAAAEWLVGARDGSVLNRSGDAYKPSALRGYAAALADEGRIMSDLGAEKLSAITRQDVQALADRMLAAGMTPGTVRNTLMPLRVIYRRALRDGIVAVNPCAGLELPSHRGRRDRIASPQEAARLLAALPEADRALWATALYGGLRAGELMALRWQDIDLAAGLIHVECAYDPKAGQFIAPKSRAGERKVPLVAVLRDYLIEAKLRSGGVGLAFGREDGRPFSGTALRDRALRAWKAAGLAPITPHECRHTFASLMIAAGVNAKSLSTWMGHANISITLDRYGHLMPGAEGEGAALMDAYLSREAEAAARRAPEVVTTIGRQDG